VLDEAVVRLKANPSVTVNVNGYCDSIGSEDYNLKLSERRADAVTDYLEKAGIPSSQLIPGSRSGWWTTAPVRDFRAPKAHHGQCFLEFLSSEAAAPGSRTHRRLIRLSFLLTNGCSAARRACLRIHEPDGF
jgi:hypothetical protein